MHLLGRSILHDFSMIEQILSFANSLIYKKIILFLPNLTVPVPDKSNISKTTRYLASTLHSRASNASNSSNDIKLEENYNRISIKTHQNAK